MTVVCFGTLCALLLCVGGLLTHAPVVPPHNHSHTGQGNSTRHSYHTHAITNTTAQWHAHAPLFRPGSGASPPRPIDGSGSVALSKYIFPSGNYAGRISRLFWKGYSPCCFFSWASSSSEGGTLGVSRTPPGPPEVDTLTEHPGESVKGSSEHLAGRDRNTSRRLRKQKDSGSSSNPRVESNPHTESSVSGPFFTKEHVAPTIDYIISILTPRNTTIGAGAFGTGLLSLFACMQAGNNGGGGGSNDPPPYWEPSMERTTPFRLYLSNLTLWCVASEKSQQTQVAQIIRRLGGTAREVADLLTPQEMFLGGEVEGVHLEPVAYLIQGLQRKFASLDEEARLRALLEMMRFKRKQGERVDELLARFDVVRTTARIEGQFVMSIEGYAVLLLSSMGVSHDNIAQTLAPLRGRLPNTEAQLEEITEYMRRMGHIQEHRPGNVADQLNNHSGGKGQFHYTDGDGTAMAADTPTCQNCNSNHSPHDSWGIFLGNSSNSSTMGQLFDSEYSGTESDTSSDGANSQVDFSDISNLSKTAAAAELFWQYAEAKKRWRRFTNKPVRAARRFAHKSLTSKGYGKGKGKSKSGGKGRARYNTVSEYLTNLSTNLPNNPDVLVYLQQGKGKGSSGKGFGRSGNPKDRDGNTMTCSICGSTEHFRANCTSSGTGGPPTVGLSQPTAQPSGAPQGKYLNRTLGAEPSGSFQIASRPDPPKVYEDSPFGDLLAGSDEGATRTSNERIYISNRTETSLYSSTHFMITEVEEQDEYQKGFDDARAKITADEADKSFC